MLIITRLFAASFAFLGEPSSTRVRSLMATRSEPNLTKNDPLEKLCDRFDVTPTGMIRLQSAENERVRGVFINHDVSKNGVILKVPLKHCVRDDSPPLWYAQNQESAPIDDENNPHHYNPSEWAVRLAASIIDMQLKFGSDNEDKICAEKDWLSMMPDKDVLRASLPIHWPEEILSESKCTALEIATDASYFARAGAVSDLTVALQLSDIASSIDINRLCNDALDLVQTRSCRIESIDGNQISPPLRVMAPVFDFINHGSSRYCGKGSSNAYFGLEGSDDDQALVVRARRDIPKNHEVLIDYGDSARPAWRCLSSYGFVPSYRVSMDGDEYFEGEDESVAEVYYNGGRYEVSADTIPTELVEAAQVSYLEEEEGIKAAYESMDEGELEEEANLLTPEVAFRISKRLSDAAFDLMIDHPEEKDHNHNQAASEIKIAKDLQQLLRWSQHKVLLACAIGLRDYAARSKNLP